MGSKLNETVTVVYKIGLIDKNKNFFLYFIGKHIEAKCLSHWFKSALNSSSKIPRPESRKKEYMLAYFTTRTKQVAQRTTIAYPRVIINL